MGSDFRSSFDLGVDSGALGVLPFVFIASYPRPSYRWLLLRELFLGQRRVSPVALLIVKAPQGILEQSDQLLAAPSTAWCTVAAC